MKRFLCALVLALFSSAGFAQERIVDFASDVSIDVDGSLLVVETIVVQVEGQQIKRGIFRDFPTRYENHRGLTVVVPFEVLDVQRDGRAEPFKVEPLSNGMRVRIGNPAVMLPQGQHTYRISYRTGRQLGFFDQHDELYWNTTGNGWPFVIDRAMQRVRLPQRVPADKLNAEAYTGPQGARGRDAKVNVADGEFSFETTRRLAPNEGLTIVAMFPKGIVIAPSGLTRLRWTIVDNVGELVAIGAAALIIAFMLVMWWRVGRDPRKGPKFPRYEAPANMSAAAVRFVDRMGFDTRCLAAAVLGLGARGYLKVHQRDDGFVVQQTGATIPFLPGDKPLAEALFGTRSQAILSKTYDPSIATAQSELNSALARHYKGSVFKRNRWPLALAVIAGAGALGFSAALGAHPGLLIALACVLLLALFAFFKLMPAYTREGRKVQDHIEGLRQYLSVAERDDLARQKAPEMTPAEFARMLPYALALDVEKTWADRFAAVLGASAVAAAVSSYYAGDTSSWGSNSTAGLTDSFGDLDSTVSSASTAPGSSSGSSGGGSGGSSGGGGGGGGGGGW